MEQGAFEYFDKIDAFGGMIEAIEAESTCRMLTSISVTPRVHRQTCKIVAAWQFILIDDDWEKLRPLSGQDIEANSQKLIRISNAMGCPNH